MRTQPITHDEYRTIIKQLFDDYHETQILDTIQNGYYTCDLDEEKLILSDFLNDAWHDPPFSTATYESLATHANPKQSPDLNAKTRNISRNQNAKSVIDSLTLAHIKQELHDIIDYHETEYHSLFFLHDTLQNTLLDSGGDYPEYTDATTIHNTVVQWLRQEHNTDDSRLTNVSPLDPAAFTPDHITAQALLNPLNPDLHTSLLWWLHDTHPETLDEFDYFENDPNTIAPRILYPAAKDDPKPLLSN